MVLVPVVGAQPNEFAGLEVVVLLVERTVVQDGDFGDEFVCVDSNGEEPISGVMVASIDNSGAETVVTCLDETRHGFDYSMVALVRIVIYLLLCTHWSACLFTAGVTFTRPTPAMTWLGETGYCVNGTCSCYPGYVGKDCSSKVCPDNKNYATANFTDYANLLGMLADLQYASAKQKITGQPFFLNYGLHRPHLPFHSPASFPDETGKVVK